MAISRRTLLNTAGATALTAGFPLLHAHAADGPSGFYYGTDSWPTSVTGTGPYYEPVIGAGYGGYIGMADG